MDLPVTWTAVLTRAALCVLLATLAAVAWFHHDRSLYVVFFAMMSVGSAVFTVVGIKGLRSQRLEPVAQQPPSRRLAGPGRIFRRS